MFATFSLGSTAEGNGVESLRTAFAGYRLALDAHLHPAPGVQARFGGMSLGRSRIESFRIDGASGTAVRAATTADDSAIDSAVTLHLMHGGRLAVKHGGRTATLAPGAMLFSSTGHPLAMAQQRHSDMTAITVPTEQLRLSGATVEGALGRALSTADPVARSCALLLGRLLRDASANPHGEWGVVEATVTDLVRALLLLDTGQERAAGRALTASLSDRVIAYLEQHALDARLDAARIAAVHGISVRYLYVVLQQHGIRLGDFLRQKRLDHAAELLRDPLAASATTADIAHRAGFFDHAHFSRTFRSHYHCTPGEWRSGGPQRSTTDTMGRRAAL